MKGSTFGQHSQREHVVKVRPGSFKVEVARHKGPSHKLGFPRDLTKCESRTLHNLLQDIVGT